MHCTTGPCSCRCKAASISSPRVCVATLTEPSSFLAARVISCSAWAKNGLFTRPDGRRSKRRLFKAVTPSTYRCGRWRRRSDIVLPLEVTRHSCRWLLRRRKRRSLRRRCRFGIRSWFRASSSRRPRGPYRAGAFRLPKGRGGLRFRCRRSTVFRTIAAGASL